jgi:branched-chain amino acid transport system ATP-binding protein
MNILEVNGLTAKYGNNQVLWGVDIKVVMGKLIALVGGNGAGKTTLLKTVVGLVPSISGSVLFLEENITRNRVEKRVSKGIALVPEGRRLFKGLTIKENLLLGAHYRKDREKVKEDLERVLSYFPELQRIQTRIAGDISGGEQQMCAIGRALMANPKLLLVDEMSLGLAPVIVERLAAVLQKINQSEGVSIVLVEQDVEIALEISEYGYVIENGIVKAEGSSSQLLGKSEIREAYLGIA